MIQEVPIRNAPFTPFKFKRYFEVQNDKVRIFGKCEITGKDFEMFVPTDEFYVYLQKDKTIGEALKSVPKEKREFLLSGISPEGWKRFFKGKKY